ncbi:MULTISPECIES: hypothetical protein [Chromobacterium]|uniref:Uncharacterized protein n=1 Tax=Chromobacterium phragmitis TaxID=2202141 RepID=A0ABV0J0K2_9NEIS|nr:hypothetical protein [Chromobacterium sp. ASV23]
MSIDKLKLHGAMELVLLRKDGSVETRRKDNLIVDVGFDLVCDALGNAKGRPGVLSHIAVGTGTDPVASNQKALSTELARLAATYAHSAGTKVFTMTSTFNAGTATGAITEAGVFNAASNGIMFDRVLFNVINKGSDDTLTVTFTFTLS